MKTGTTVWIGLLATLIAVQGANAESLVLVADGRPAAAIVLPAKPSAAARKGAEIFRDHLFQMSGTRLEILSERDLGDVTVQDGCVVLDGEKDEIQNFVLLGEGDVAGKLGASSEGLGPGGTLVRTYPNALVLLGADQRTPSDPHGTRYAVTTFLEDVLGCRYLWPGESGKVVPERPTLEIAELDRSFTPVLKQRRIRSIGYSDRLAAGLEKLSFTKQDYEQARARGGATRSADGGWFGWHRMGGSLGLASGHAFGHLWDKYGEAHPDWFALQPNGSRDQSELSPHRSRLCVSNQELIETIAIEKIEELNRTGRESVSVGPNDGGRATFCMCTECKKLDPPEARKIQLWDFTSGERRSFEYVSLTDRYVYFWNQIAERVTEVHPDAWLTADAYSVYAAPPVKRTLHPNVAIRFVGINYLDDEARRQGRADWDAWAEAASKIYFRPNLLLAGRRQGTPAIFVHKMAEDFRSIAQNSMIGTDFDACVHNWATQGLNYYVLAKLHWDPNHDVDAIIDDYCRTGFGNAAEPVKRYLMRLEELTDRVAAEKLHVTEPYTPEVIRELRGYLGQTHEAAAGNAAVQDRLALLRRGLDYTEVHAHAYRLVREFEMAGRLTPDLRERARKVLDRNWIISRDIFRKHHYGVNVAYVAWGGWGYFRRLGWNGPSPETKAKAEALPVDGTPQDSASATDTE